MLAGVAWAARCGPGGPPCDASAAFVGFPVKPALRICKLTAGFSGLAALGMRTERQGPQAFIDSQRKRLRAGNKQIGSQV